MKWASFGEVLEIKNGRNQKRVENPVGPYPIYGSGGIMGYADDYLCDAETVVIGRKGSINNPIFVEQPFWNVDTAFGLSARKGVLNAKYLYYFCKQFDFNRLNTTVTIPSLTKANLLDVKIPLPPLAEQRRIAAILDKADAIRRKRQQSLELVDNLLKSVFLNMFGDPVTNPKGWEKVRVGTLLKNIEAGWSANGVARIKQHGELAVLKVSAVTYGVFDENEYKVIESGTSIQKHIYPQKGDLLFSRANTRELVGATCLIFNDYPDLLLPDKLWKLHFNEKTNNYYMKFALSSADARGQMTGESTGTSGSMYNISMEKLKNIRVCLPPVVLQNKFAAIAESMEASRCILRQANNEADNTFKSLQQSFFG